MTARLQAHASRSGCCALAGGLMKAASRLRIVMPGPLLKKALASDGRSLASFSLTGAMILALAIAPSGASRASGSKSGENESKSAESKPAGEKSSDSSASKD